MLIVFPEVQKAPADVKTVELDWEPILSEIDRASAITAHTAWTEAADPTVDFGEAMPPGVACVVAVDVGMNGLVQLVQLSAGYPDLYSLVTAQLTLADGDTLARSFQVTVR